MVRKRSDKAGLPPGSLVAVGGPSVGNTTISVFIYDANGFSEQHTEKADEVTIGDPAKSVTWIDIDGLGDLHVIASVAERFGLHQLMVEDVLNQDHRPKIDEYQDHLFVVVKMLSFGEEAQEVRSEQVSLVLGKGLVITFQGMPGDVLGPVRDRIRNDTGRVRKKGADFLLYSMLDVIVDNYFQVVEVLGERIESLEQQVSSRPRNADLITMQELRRQLIGVSRQVTPTRELAGRMNIMQSALIDKSTRRYINDLQDHTVYIAESIAIFRDLLANLENTYHAGVNMRMGQVMKLLTVISTIFIPLTFVVGVYGMNFDNMPELHWKYGYFIVMGFMLVLSLLMLAWFRRKHWL